MASFPSTHVLGYDCVALRAGDVVMSPPMQAARPCHPKVGWNSYLLYEQKTGAQLKALQEKI